MQYNCVSKRLKKALIRAKEAWDHFSTSDRDRQTRAASFIQQLFCSSRLRIFHPRRTRQWTDITIQGCRNEHTWISSHLYYCTSHFFCVSKIKKTRRDFRLFALGLMYVQYGAHTYSSKALPDYISDHLTLYGLWPSLRSEALLFVLESRIKLNDIQPSPKG